MRRRSVLALAMIAVTVWPALAMAAGVAELSQALRLPELFKVLREEGIRQAAEMEAELFPGMAGGRWQEVAARIHDPARMAAIVEGRLAAETRDHAGSLDGIVRFMSGDPGARIVALELAAREAFLDEAMREAAEMAWSDMRAEADPRLALIDRLVVANDLIEQNVAGALNGQLAFYQGMREGGALDDAMPEAEMMADLWSQEPQVRADTESWLLPYMVLAYKPLSDADLEAYVDFSLTTEGQVLNRALFAAFDQLFNVLSRALGLAAARLATGQDI